jgi:cobalt-zinc-cadmium resistance protein CzcA
MVRQFIRWAVDNPFLVMLMAVALAIGGGYAVAAVNIEAYPDPAPAIIEVVAQYPGASAEEVERLITIPLEVTLAGMPGLETCRSKSLFGLAHLRNQFSYARDYEQAKQDVINRLALVNLPAGVTPQISPASPIGEILRYTLSNPIDPNTHKPVYTLNDLKALQDYVVARELLRVQRIAGVTIRGGTTKRYEVQPDPVRLNQYGISLNQLQTALGNSNVNGSGDNLTQGQLNVIVRTLGLFGQGQDPQQLVLGLSDPVRAAQILREEEARRCVEIRQSVITSTNNIPIRVDQLVDGGPMLDSDGAPRVDDQTLTSRGVIINHQTRQGRVSIARQQRDDEGNYLRDTNDKPNWNDEDDVVEGIVLLRKGQESLPALRDLQAKVEELNKPGHLLPGVQIVPYYNRTELINRTTDTVYENLLVGMGLVSVILLMFLSNVRAAIIVALNIPLALLFAFGAMYLRNKSANLLSIGAVDFGIIVDSSVIIVESIYSHLQRPGVDSELSPKILIYQATSHVERSLFFATIIMVCALLPLFTMKGPEGQIFGPMADTYAFALAGALVLAFSVSPVLCLLLFRKMPRAGENFLVRGLKALFLFQLRFLLRARWLAVTGFVAIMSLTTVVAMRTGREFMPELEEGSIFIRGTFPINISLGEVTQQTHKLRDELKRFPELAVIVPAIGRPDDGTDPTGYYNVEANNPLLPEEKWPRIASLGRPRTKPELVREIMGLLQSDFPGVDWEISQIIRDNVMEALSGVKGENSIKIFGPDLGALETLATKVRDRVNEVPGVENASVFRTQGQSNFEFPVDRQKCARWNVTPADVQAVVAAAVGGKAFTQMQEGGKTFDIIVRWPSGLRSDEYAILQIPVPVNNQVSSSSSPSVAATPFTSSATGLSPTGTSMLLPVATGNSLDAPAITPLVPARRLKDLVTPSQKPDGNLATHGYLRAGASTIYREQGQRLIAVKFSVQGRDLAGTVAEARSKVEPLLQLPYRTEWSGEFQEMGEAENRLIKTFSLSLILIGIIIYLAFRSILDGLVVFANVLAVGVGGIWALKITGLNFNISAAVGFISILGVAVMNGLLLVASYNRLRAEGMELKEALMIGTGQRIRPLFMTVLTAVLGLLPAALSTRIGSQSQRPLAVVVVGGMIFTLIVFNLVPVLYSFYGKRTPAEMRDTIGH